MTQTATTPRCKSESKKTSSKQDCLSNEDRPLWTHNSASARIHLLQITKACIHTQTSFYCSCDLTLTGWSSYMNLTQRFWWHTRTMILSTLGNTSLFNWLKPVHYVLTDKIHASICICIRRILKVKIRIRRKRIWTNFVTTLSLIFVNNLSCSSCSRNRATHWSSCQATEVKNG